MNSLKPSQDKRQIKISISNEYLFDLKNFKKYIIDCEGTFKGNFQVYLINAINFFMRSNRTPITEEITAEKIYKKKYEKNLKQILEIKEYFYKKQISTEKKEQYLYKNIIEKLDEII